MSLRPKVSLGLCLALAVSVFLAVASQASAAPTVSGFAASPSALPSSGGSVSLSAVVGGTATTCKFTVAPALSASGLPATVPCTAGSVSLDVTVPANAATTGKVYTFKLQVSGGGSVQATPALVTVAPTPPPSISAFSATPSYLPPSGGLVNLSASASDAATCKFSANPNVSGLPLTLPCTSGSASANVTLPANTQANPRTYTFTLTASRSGVSVVSTQTVIVATPAHQADLAVSQSDSPDPVQVGGSVTYTLTVQNSGPNQATGVTLVDTLPSGASFSGASPSQGTCSPSSGTVSCDLGVLAANGSASVSVTVQTTTVGSISNSATVSGNQTDPNATNNSWTEESVVQATKIAYLADGVPDTSVQGIWAMNPDGTDNVRIVAGQASDAVLSPDRSKLVYSIFSPSTTTWELWVIGIDGSDDHFLYSLGNSGVTASWSGDGEKVIFATRVDVAGTLTSKAIVVNVTGTPDPRLLLPSDAGGESAPAFSPNGQWVVFRGAFPRATRYHIVDADGLTTPEAFVNAPFGDLGVVWSPGSDSFYFTSGSTTIYRASIDPSQSASVVTADLAEGPTRWALSPQGDRIAFTTRLNVSSPVTAVVDVVGGPNSNYKQITTAPQGSPPVGCYSPVWSPTGADVIMHCYFGGAISIYKASSTTSSPVNPTFIGGQFRSRDAVYAGLRPTR